MITKLEITDCASFDHKGVEINNLKQVNFIYGANGSGKTTISNVIVDQSQFQRCNIDWKNGTENGILQIHFTFSGAVSRFTEVFLKKCQLLLGAYEGCPDIIFLKNGKTHRILILMCFVPF